MNINVFAVDDDGNSCIKTVIFEELCKYLDSDKSMHDILCEMS